MVMSNWPLVRNVILFCGGFLGAGYEVIFEQADKPSLILLLAAMMGLPAFLDKDK